MPLATPWDLVVADAVPTSIEWWALSALPAGGYQLAAVQAARLADLGVQVEYDAPEQPQASRLAWRAFTAVVSSPATGGSPPYTVAALAFVETDGGTVLLGVFPLQAAFTLNGGGDSQEISGFIQVSKYQ